ncbi:Helix-turn-helix domain-containing protein [Filimonas lacunae]|uniref:Helix-turn-helix domain-containing protein n=1 Tax=Filimonas lacunae TaxID=477680 RepID=A0A1N7R8K2_9BACT|nr:helix-turn-helix domain-containing protein [Filimonas lacunae]SIT31379.1 Helix-turn-helix domain-containing protein [Filimonas lacunae]
MDTILIPNEGDFKRWIKEAIKECIGDLSSIQLNNESTSEQEPLLSRKEIAGIFKVSLVTLHEWMKGGLPFHKQGGRVYFFKSEVIAYIKQKRGNNSVIQMAILKHVA